MPLQDGRISSIDRVMSAMEELDHSELTRGNVKAAARDMESIQNEIKKTGGNTYHIDQLTGSFAKLLSMAEKGNWTELRNSRNNGLIPAAREEVNTLFEFFDRHSVGSITPHSIGGNVSKKPDRGYPPQHTAESERDYRVRKREVAMEHRDRRQMEPSPAPSQDSDYDKYELRRRDDPKQVSNQMSRIASERLRSGQVQGLEELTKSPQRVAKMFADLYNREWTAAYEELNMTFRDGAETIQHLTKIMQSAYDYCTKTAERQIINLLNGVENEMLYPNITQHNRQSLEAQQRPDRNLVAVVRDGDEMIKEFRKYAATASLPVVKWLFYEEVMKTIQPAQHPTNSQLHFIDRLLEVTWLICTQNPPMSLQFCHNGDRLTDAFRPFTRMGKVVQNCVWPALLAYEDGPLIEKGIAHLG